MAESNAKKHHYISACYLKYFANPQKRTGRIYALDKDNKKQYPTTPNDAGCKRDFNYVHADGIHPNSLEDCLGESLEAYFPNVVDYIVNKCVVPKPKSDYYNILISLISLFTVRNPATRKKTEDFENRVRDVVLDMLVSKKEIWDSNLKNMKRDGYEAPNIKFKDVQNFVRNKKYEISYPKGYHIGREMDMQNTIFPYLYDRKWELLISDNKYFISSNKPVILAPTTSKSTCLPLGFGLKETAVIFPLTNKMCLVGTFENKFRSRNISDLEVQEINGFVAKSDNRFIYSTEESFSVFNYQTMISEKESIFLI